MAKAKPRTRKPDKPYSGYPLTAHANGQWCKKIRGKVHFFGVWANPDAALDNYNRQAPDLKAGRTPGPRATGEEVSVRDLANAYLQSQEDKAKRGIITPRWFEDCEKTVKAFAMFIGLDRPWDDLRPDDLAKYRMHLYDKYGVCAIDRAITVIRGMFKHAYDTDLIDRPIKYGSQFDKPTAKEKRQERAKRDRANGKRLFTPTEIRELLKATDGPLHAMILLGINGGFGNTDCAELPVAALDLNNGLIDYERPKTAVHRVVPLWPETITAIRSVLKDRPEPKKEEYGKLVFLTAFGNPWKKERLKGSTADAESRVGRQEAVSAQFQKLLKKLKMKRVGLGFYALRHTFRTWADEAKDQHAVHRIMGHAIPGMSGVYVEEVSMERLRAVTNLVYRKVSPIDS